MKLSIIIPAFNEQATIESLIRKVFEVDLGEWGKEVIVVNDASTDRSLEILEKLQQEIYFVLITHSKNLGKGAAIKTALAEAHGDYVIIQDADLEYSPSDIPALLREVQANPSTVVYGARGTKRYPERGMDFVLGAKLLTWLVNMLYGSRLADLYTGYKLMSATVLKSLELESTGFEFEAEVTCKLLKKGARIREVPINYTPRSKAQGKHIGLKDFFKGFWTVLKNL